MPSNLSSLFKLTDASGLLATQALAKETVQEEDAPEALQYGNDSEPGADSMISTAELYRRMRNASMEAATFLRDKAIETTYSQRVYPGRAF